MGGVRLGLARGPEEGYGCIYFCVSRSVYKLSSATIIHYFFLQPITFQKYKLFYSRIWCWVFLYCFETNLRNPLHNILLFCYRFCVTHEAFLMHLKAHNFIQQVFFFLSWIFLQLRWPIKPQFSQVCYLCLGHIEWWYWSLINTILSIPFKTSVEFTITSEVSDYYTQFDFKLTLSG